MKIQFEIKNRQVFLAIIFISFITLTTLAIAITAVNPGHTSNDVIISIGGAEKTLQSAIDTFEIGETIFKEGVDGSVLKQVGWAKINIKGTFYVLPLYNLTESIVRVYTNGKAIEGHTIASDAYLCTYDDFRDYSPDTFCQAFGYSKGSAGNVGCRSVPSQPVEYRNNGAWGRTSAGSCSGQGLCYGPGQYIEFIDCKK